MRADDPTPTTPTTIPATSIPTAAQFAAWSRLWDLLLRDPADSQPTTSDDPMRQSGGAKDEDPLDTVA